MSEAVIHADPESTSSAREALDPMLYSIDKYVKINQTGDPASATPSNMAMGERANASGYIGIAFGVGSRSTGNYGVAIGVNSVASDNAVALGGTAQATKARSVALGSGSIVDKDNTVSVGSLSQRRVIRFLADGDLTASSHEAVTGSQLFATNARIDALGSSSEYIAINQTGAPPSATSSNMAIGQQAKASGYIAMAFGVVSHATGNYSTAIGYGAGAADNAVALGGSASAGHARSVALGSGSVADKDNTVSVGSLSQRRAIRFLADGELASSSHEAVTGRQLFATNQLVDANTAAIATNAENITANATHITELSQQVSDGSLGLVKQDAASRTLTMGAQTNGTLVNLAGTQGARRLSGVSNGQDATDAATVGQLETALKDPLLTRYDSAARTALTFNPGGTATRLGNVADGASAGDAVNKAQLDTLDGRVTTLSGTVSGQAGRLDELDKLAVKYAASRKEIPLDKVKISGLADGVNDKDAVNKGQLDVALVPLSEQIGSVSQSLGDILKLVTDVDAAAVKYDAADKARVTFNAKGAGSVLGKVLPGEKGDDAVNKTQLDSAIAPVEQKLADALVYSNRAHTLVTLNPDQDAARLSNLADGTAAKDAVNFGQLSPVLAKVRFLSAKGSADAEAEGQNAMAVGGNAKATGKGGVAVGANTTATATYDVAIGYNAKAEGEQNGSTVYAGIALGNTTKSVSTGVAIGQAAKALALGTIALGHFAGAEGGDATSVGHGAQALNNAALALGPKSKCAAPGAVALGAQSVAEEEATVSVGNPGLKRRVTNVAEGFDYYDAVVVGQFQSLRLEHEQLKQSSAVQYQQLEQKYLELEARLRQLSSKLEAA